MITWSTGALTVSIGDIRVAVITQEPDLSLGVHRTTRRFVVDNVVDDEADMRVRVRWGEARHDTIGGATFDSGGLWKLYQQDSNYLFRFTSPVFGPLPYKQACLSPDFSCGDIVLHRDYFDPRQPVDALEYPLDELLITNMLTRGRGVEVHACGIEDSDGRGYLFVGQSGAGKTTTARLWQQARGIQVLSDDRIILRALEGRTWMYGTPWHGEAECASSTRTPLTHIFFLGRGETNEVIPVPPAEAVARLMACSFVPFYDAAALDHALAFLARVAESAPCRELRFVVDDRVLKFVREYADEYRSSIQGVC